jgi:hypothetical protein
VTTSSCAFTGKRQNEIPLAGISYGDFRTLFELYIKTAWISEGEVQNSIIAATFVDLLIPNPQTLTNPGNNNTSSTTPPTNHNIQCAKYNVIFKY